MNPSSLHLQTHVTGQTDKLKTGPLSKVEKNFTQKNYGEAFDKLIFFFGSREPDDEVKRAYGYLCAVLPRLEETDIRSLYDKIFPSLHMLPDLTQQQSDLALALANRYAAQPSVTEDTPGQNAEQAMHFYAKALAIANQHLSDQSSSIHSLASQHFMRIIRAEMLEKKQFKHRLDSAKRKDDKELFQKILNDVELLKCSCDKEIIEDLYEQAEAVFSDKHARHDPSFNDRFIPQIKKALQELYRSSNTYITQKYEKELKGYRASSEKQFTNTFSSKKPEPA